MPRILSETMDFPIVANTAARNGNGGWKSARKHFEINDGSNGARQVTPTGFQPYALPLGAPADGASGTAITLAANGGAIAIPFVLEGHFKIQSVDFWNTDTGTARGGVEWRMFEERDNVLGTFADCWATITGSLSTWTPSAASKRTATATIQGNYMGPGAYWLLFKNNHATNNMGLGGINANVLAGSACMTKTLTASAFTSTIDMTSGWSKNTSIPLVRISGQAQGGSTWV